MTTTPDPNPTPHSALLQHFADLRDGHHGRAHDRGGKEQVYTRAVGLLAPYARQVLDEMNTALLLDTGSITDTGILPTAGGGSEARWLLSWPEQQHADLPPITLSAYFGAGFHHPHLRGGTVGEWPLNLSSDDEAREQLATLRAISAAEIHNLVFARDYRIVPTATSGKSR